MTTVEGRPRHAQRPARRRHADLQCERLGRHQQSFALFRFSPSSPDIFPCTSRIVCAVASSFSQSSDLRLKLAHLGDEGVVFGWFRAAFLRRQTLKRAASARLAPSRQMRGVQTLAAKQTPDLARARTSVRLLDNPQPILGGELAPRRLGDHLRIRSRSLLLVFGPGGLVATLLGPQGRRVRLHPGHRVCLCSHRFSPPRPTLIPRGAGVSGMLAERAVALERAISAALQSDAAYLGGGAPLHRPAAQASRQTAPARA